MKKLVHVIEDDPDILFVMELIFENSNFEIMADYNGDNFNLDNEPCPDLFIIDVHLSKRNGADICRHIKEHCPHIPVIIMSASTNLQSIATACNADKFITKPFEITAVLDAANELTAMQ